MLFILHTTENFPNGKDFEGKLYYSVLFEKESVKVLAANCAGPEDQPIRMRFFVMDGYDQPTNQNAVIYCAAFCFSILPSL